MNLHNKLSPIKQKWLEMVRSFQYLNYQNRKTDENEFLRMQSNREDFCYKMKDFRDPDTMLPVRIGWHKQDRTFRTKQAQKCFEKVDISFSARAVKHL